MGGKYKEWRDCIRCHCGGGVGDLDGCCGVGRGEEERRWWEGR